MAIGSLDNVGVRIADFGSDLLKIVSHLEGNPSSF